MILFVLTEFTKVTNVQLKHNRWTYELSVYRRITQMESSTKTTCKALDSSLKTKQIKAPMDWAFQLLTDAAGTVLLAAVHST